MNIYNYIRINPTVREILGTSTGSPHHLRSNLSYVSLQ